MQLKKVCCFVLVLFVLCCTTGCAKHIGFIEETGNSTVNIEGESWSETRSYPVKLEDNAAIRVDAAVQSGKLRLTIEKAGEAPIYSGILTEDFAFTVNADAGKYSISLTGENYTGQCSIRWK